MAEIKDGILVDPKVIQNTVSNIEHETLDLKKITSIVIHQTGSRTAQDTIDGWKIRKFGAHFLIDSGVEYKVGKKIRHGIDGQINQTGHLDKRCWHINNFKVPVHPVNSNSIGIELVAMYDNVNKTYPVSTSAQISSSCWLIKTLIELLSTISADKLYAHGVISHKDENSTEGKSSLDEIKKELDAEKPKEITVHSSIQLPYMPMAIDNTRVVMRMIPLQLLKEIHEKQ